MYEDFWRALGGDVSSPVRRAPHQTGVCSPGWRRSTSRAASSDLLTGRRGRLPLAGGAADLLCAAAERPPQLEGASTVAAMLCTTTAAWSLAGGAASPSTSRPPPTAAPTARLVMSGSTQPPLRVLDAPRHPRRRPPTRGAHGASEAAAFQSALGEAAIDRRHATLILALTLALTLVLTTATHPSL